MTLKISNLRVYDTTFIYIDINFNLSFQRVWKIELSITQRNDELKFSQLAMMLQLSGAQLMKRMVMNRHKGKIY